MAGPSRRGSDPEPTLSIFPDQLHIGDRFDDAETGDEPHEWEVASRPGTFKKGHEVRARVQRPGNPATAREKYWEAHEKITVRGVTAAPTPPTAGPGERPRDAAGYTGIHDLGFMVDDIGSCLLGPHVQ